MSFYLWNLYEYSIFTGYNEEFLIIKTMIQPKNRDMLFLQIDWKNIMNIYHYEDYEDYLIVN